MSIAHQTWRHAQKHERIDPEDPRVFERIVRLAQQFGGRDVYEPNDALPCFLTFPDGSHLSAQIHDGRRFWYLGNRGQDVAQEEGHDEEK